MSSLLANSPSIPLILAIDTSCDETSVAITQGQRILANVVASQTQLHKQYGGVFPTVAKQAHKENIGPSVVAALKRAHVEWSEIAAIAVTQGPGLAPALEVGINTAKELCLLHQKPLIPSNHLEGHLLSVLTQPQTQLATITPQFPALGLIISGKHSDFILIKEIGQYQRLGWTIDDAPGEALDKVGRMLGLGYPAGSLIEEFSKLGSDQTFTFPLPMTTSGDYNLSFSGLKTFARNKIEALEAEKTLTKTQIYDFCASFQRAVFRSICYKLSKILKNHEIKEVWLGGGVAANSLLRAMVRAEMKKVSPSLPALRVPYSKKLCGDNAAMIGVAAGYTFERGEVLKEAQEYTELDRAPRLSL